MKMNTPEKMILPIKNIRIIALDVNARIELKNGIMNAKKPMKINKFKNKLMF